jgi:hypothetical protein
MVNVVICQQKHHNGGSESNAELCLLQIGLDVRKMATIHEAGTLQSPIARFSDSP